MWVCFLFCEPFRSERLSSGIDNRQVQRPGRRLAASAVVALALVSLFFLLQIVPHTHVSGQDDPACRLCQVAHLGIAVVAAVTLLSLILVYFGETATPACLYTGDAFSAQSPSRAPPALIA